MLKQTYKIIYSVLFVLPFVLLIQGAEESSTNMLSSVPASFNSFSSAVGQLAAPVFFVTLLLTAFAAWIVPSWIQQGKGSKASINFVVDQPRKKISVDMAHSLFKEAKENYKHLCPAGRESQFQLSIADRLYKWLWRHELPNKLESLKLSFEILMDFFDQVVDDKRKAVCQKYVAEVYVCAKVPEKSAKWFHDAATSYCAVDKFDSAVNCFLRAIQYVESAQEKTQLFLDAVALLVGTKEYEGRVSLLWEHVKASVDHKGTIQGLLNNVKKLSANRYTQFSSFFFGLAENIAIFNAKLLLAQDNHVASWYIEVVKIFLNDDRLEAAIHFYNTVANDIHLKRALLKELLKTIEKQLTSEELHGVMSYFGMIDHIAEEVDPEIYQASMDVYRQAGDALKENESWSSASKCYAKVAEHVMDGTTRTIFFVLAAEMYLRIGQVSDTLELYSKVTKKELHRKEAVVLLSERLLKYLDDSDLSVVIGYLKIMDEIASDAQDGAKEIAVDVYAQVIPSLMTKQKSIALLYFTKVLQYTQNKEKILTCLIPTTEIFIKANKMKEALYLCTIWAANVKDKMPMIHHLLNRINTDTNRGLWNILIIFFELVLEVFQHDSNEEGILTLLKDLLISENLQNFDEFAYPFLAKVYLNILRDWSGESMETLQILGAQLRALETEYLDLWVTTDGGHYPRVRMNAIASSSFWPDISDAQLRIWNKNPWERYSEAQLYSEHSYGCVWKARVKDSNKHVLVKEYSSYRHFFPTVWRKVIALLKDKPDFPFQASDNLHRAMSIYRETNLAFAGLDAAGYIESFLWDGKIYIVFNFFESPTYFDTFIGLHIPVEGNSVSKLSEFRIALARGQYGSVWGASEEASKDNQGKVVKKLPLNIAIFNGIKNLKPWNFKEIASLVLLERYAFSPTVFDIVLETPKNEVSAVNQLPVLNVIMEKVPGETLASWSEQHADLGSSLPLKIFLYKLILQVSVLHEHAIFHLDLHDQNVFVQWDEKQLSSHPKNIDEHVLRLAYKAATVSIIDFGEVRFCDDGKTSIMGDAMTDISNMKKSNELKGKSCKQHEWTDMKFIFIIFKDLKLMPSTPSLYDASIFPDAENPHVKDLLNLPYFHDVREPLKHVEDEYDGR